MQRALQGHTNVECRRMSRVRWDYGGPRRLRSHGRAGWALGTWYLGLDWTGLGGVLVQELILVLGLILVLSLILLLVLILILILVLVLVCESSKDTQRM